MRTNWEKQNKLNQISTILERNLRKEDILDLFSTIMEWAGKDDLTLTEKIQAINDFQVHTETPHFECCEPMLSKIENNLSLNLICPKCGKIKKIPEIVYRLYRNGELARINTTDNE